jgi:protein phosphatase
MIVDLDACCDLGRVRNNNEDMILVGEELLRDRAFGARLTVEPAQGRLVVAVADGMGGAAAGERASEHAMTRLAELMRQAPADLDDDELTELLEIWATRTHVELLDQGIADPACRGMGTTAVGLLLRHGRAWRFHAGDSRLYRLRDGQLEQLTQDHVAPALQSGTATPKQLLANSLGGGDRSWLEVERLDGELRVGDRFLLSSDGLHDLIDAPTLQLALQADRETAVRTLVRLAHGAGGTDNISVLIVDIARAEQAAAGFAPAPN